MPEAALRVLDFGSVRPLRSQTLWHAVARGVSAGAPPTISFVRPTDPYVCLGYHRRIDEVDLDLCARRGLPVYRRMVGGGPVYLDNDQLFFQVCLPLASLPARRDKALRLLLEPAVEAFRAVGVDASLDRSGEIVVGDAKVCGHGAAQIDEAVAFVGNLIEHFDHEAASDVVQSPSPEARDLLARLIRRYVRATPCDADAFREAATDAYASAFGLEPSVGSLTSAEEEAVAELDGKFEDPRWRDGLDRAAQTTDHSVWRVKVRAGVWAVEAELAGSRLLAAVVDGRLEAVSVDDAELNGSAAAVERAIAGWPLGEAEARLVAFGPPGQRLAEALARVGRRLE